jgi:non-specific serine/threonine protein kinase
VYRVNPMQTPVDIESMPEAILDYDAARLFCDRAVLVDNEFSLDADGAADIVQVCRGLDGIPLALELAAGRLGDMTLSELTAGLSNRLGLLVGGPRTVARRQQTLHAAIDWSYELLSPAEQELFARLAVFAGTFPEMAAREVCSDDKTGSEATPELLRALAERSLVVREEREQESRYRVLETIREFGLALLRSRGELDRISAAHLDWYARWVRDVRHRLFGPEQSAYVAAVEEDYPNIRAALEWGAAQQAVPALELATGMYAFWTISSRLSEGAYWLERTLPATGATAVEA